MAVQRSDVEDLASNGWQHLSDTKKDNLLSIAERQADTLYAGNVSTLPEIEGDRDDFVKFLAAHLWELSEGGEAQSESSTGGSVNYNTVTGDALNGLSETRYGRQAEDYLRESQSIGIVRTY